MCVYFLYYYHISLTNLYVSNCSFLSFLYIYTLQINGSSKTQITGRDVNVFEGPTTIEGLPAIENDYENSNGGFLPADIAGPIRALTARQDNLVLINGENVISASCETI